MLKHALIGGGSGFVGTRLTKHLASNGYEVTIISRMPGPKRITWHDLEQKGIPKGVTTVVNLSGQNVLDPSRRWTAGFKQNVYNSRINSSTSLVNAIAGNSHVQSFINISGVALYRPNNEKIYSEDDQGEEYDFMSKLCLDWEKAATIPSNVPCRNVKIRTGVVIGREGGMIKSILLPFQLGLGGPMGDGQQPLPWIHIEDLCRLIQHGIENKTVSGVLNGVAPDRVTNLQFSKTFASALRRPAVFPMPEFVVNAIFGKERSALLLLGAKIKPKRTLASGFEFKYPTAEKACAEVVQKSN